MNIPAPGQQPSTAQRLVMALQRTVQQHDQAALHLGELMRSKDPIPFEQLYMASFNVLALKMQLTDLKVDLIGSHIAPKEDRPRIVVPGH